MEVTVSVGTKRGNAQPLAVGRPAVARQPAEALVVTIFVASGAAGLIYQVVWARQLVLVFGNTTEAIGTIVSAFMAGLGLGGLVGGLIAPRLRQSLRAYGLVELAVGLTALLVPLGFHLIEDAYRVTYDSASPQELTAARLALSLATVTPVTFLMGLTLPLLTGYLVTSMRTAGAYMGRLYSANTFGAMAGTLVCGFILIEWLGLSATARVAVGLNLLAGSIAVLLARQQPETRSVFHGDEDDRGQVPALTRSQRRLVCAATFVSGFVALALEVLWTRMLAEGTGSRIYLFVVVLAIYLFGIAAGGAAYRVSSRSGRDGLHRLAMAFTAIALSTALTVPVGSMLLPGRWVPIANLVRAFMMLPATFGMGYAFPLSARLLTTKASHGAKSIGMLYAWNTIGSILGSLAAAFILAGTLGTNGSILVLGAAEAAIALALLLGARRPAPRLRLHRASAGLAPLAAALVVVPLVLVATGSPLLLTATEQRLEATGLPFHHTEDRISTVDARGGPPAQRRLYASGTTMTAISVDTKLMAYLPRVIRPNARDFLDICFGMGTTFRSAILLGMHTDAVDLSPSVPQEMPVFYRDAQAFLHSPLGRIITADGRNYVRLSARRYDIISVDPPPPIQTAGSAVLYAREFYADAHQRLRPGGLMLEWLYFGVDLQELREHLRTFRSVFPHVLILISPRHGGLFMLGSDAAITWNRSIVSQVLESPTATTDIESAPDSRGLPPRPWADILDRMRWLQDGDVDQFAGPGPLITDDHPRNEYYVLHWLGGAGQSHEVTERMLRKLWPGR